MGAVNLWFDVMGGIILALVILFIAFWVLNTIIRDELYCLIISFIITIVILANIFS